MKKEPDERPPNLTTAIAALETGAGLVPRITPTASIDAARASSNVYAAASGKLTPAPAGAITMAPVPRRRWPLVAGALLAIAAIAGVAIALGGGKDEPAPVAVRPPPPAPAPVVPPAPPPAPPKPPAPVEPAAVTLTITSAPAGTEVHGPGGKFLGNPPKIQLARGSDDVVLTFEADGYKPTSRTVVPAADATLDVRLDKKPSVRAAAPPVHPVKPPASQDTIEDPFHK